jgi:regulator of ribosome biosynthesis
VAVSKPTPYVFDLGLLLASDLNPLSVPTAAAPHTAKENNNDDDDEDIEDASSPTTPASTTEALLAAVARDGAQALINQLLTTCTPTSTTSGVTLALPAPHTRLPREKPVPEAKPLTKWEEFAKRKGIQGKTRDSRKNQVYDNESGEWRKRWGKDGLNKKQETEWLVEVDDAAKQRARAAKLGKRGGKADDLEAASGEINPRSLARAERVERVKRNERRMRKNEWRATEARRVKAL